MLVARIQDIGRVNDHRFILISTKFGSLVHPTVCNDCRRVDTLTTSNHSLRRTPAIRAIITKPLYRSNSIFARRRKKGIRAHTLPRIGTNSCLMLRSAKTCNTSVSSGCGDHPLLPRILFSGNRTQLVHHHRAVRRLLTLRLLWLQLITNYVVAYLRQQD